MKYMNGDNYLGEWFEDRFKGKGNFSLKNGDFYNGLFLNHLNNF
jgi:hypothetical protein